MGSAIIKTGVSDSASTYRPNGIRDLKEARPERAADVQSPGTPTKEVIPTRADDIMGVLNDLVG